jgi:hypothetical protein
MFVLLPQGVGIAGAASLALVLFSPLGGASFLDQGHLLFW